MTAWIDSTVLITGGTGFAGRWLAASLAGRGARVVAMARHAQRRDVFPDPPHAHYVPIQCDVTDHDGVARALREFSPVAVFHLAGQAIVGDALADPMSTFETNVKGTWVVLEACRRAAVVPRIVVASSEQAYGMQQHVPCDESQPLAGRSPYDVSKSCADLIALAYAASYAMPIGVARCSNLYGPGDLNFSRLVPGTILSALKGEAPVIRSDGTPVRDYLHVDDMVDGFVRLAERLSEPALPGRAFNFGTGRPHSVLQLTQMILEAAGRADLQPRILGQPSGRTDRRQLTIDAAERDLGWRVAAATPQRLRDTVAWYRNHMAVHGMPATAGH